MEKGNDSNKTTHWKTQVKDCAEKNRGRGGTPPNDELLNPNESRIIKNDS